MNKILIVDTNERSAELIAKHLSRNGYDVVIMHNAKGIFVNLKFSKPDLIVLDCELGTESGFDVCRKIKSNEDVKYIPILMIGSNESANALTRSLESGSDDYMPKSFDANIVLSKVKSLIRIKHLSDELKNKYTELEEKNKMIEMQLEMAMQVQRSLIKEMQIKHNHVEFVTKYLPALDIGGDFYDIVKLNDDIISVVIGDVSGHGISAALLTLMLSMMIRNFAPRYYNPAQFLFHMNNELYKTFEGSDVSMYACMFYAVIDTKKKRIYYSNAGQVFPFIVKTNSLTIGELDATGTPIGMIEDAVYEYKTQLFEDDDILLFYTDGLADNFYKDNEEEFYMRTENMLLDMCIDATPDIIANSLVSAFCSFDLENANLKYAMDDVSLIVCKM